MYIFSIFFLFITLLRPIGAQALTWKDIFINDHNQNQIISDANSKISSKCSKDTKIWLKSLEILAEVSIECLFSKKCTGKETKLLEENFFALEQLDAFGKLPSSGILNIPLVLDGSYQECQRVSGKKYETNYCYLVLIPGTNATCNPNGGLPSGSVYFRSAVCMPKSCDESDLTDIFNHVPLMPFTVCASFCSEFPVPKDSAFWGFSTFLAIMIGILLASTGFDYVRYEFRKKNKEEELPKDPLLLQVFLTFSMWTNAEQLLSVKEQKPGFIKCLDCIRFMSMLWVVTGHTFTFLLPPDFVRAPIAQFPNQFWNHLLLGAFVSVDTFFLLSGIVVAYLFFKSRPTESQIKSSITWILFYVHRFLRLTPPYMIFIGFFTVYGKYVQGPFSASEFNTLVPDVEVCEKNWWRNLLYINNMGGSENACYGPTWYLAVDTQLYLIAPIVLIGFYYSFIAGASMITAGCLGSIIAVYVLFAIYDLPADFVGNGNTALLYDMIYHASWIRCPPYLFGLLIGYGLAVFGKRRVRINWMLAVFGWIVALGIGFACIFSTYDYDKGAYWSTFSRATFYNFSRLGWAVAVSWVIVANHMGWGGPIDAFMSHPAWQPLGRLSYCAYIVHFVVLFCFLNINDSPFHFYSTFQIFIYYAVPSTLLSYIFAFFWSCLFEMPVLKLEKMLIEAIIGGQKPTRKVEDVVRPSEGVTIEVEKKNEKKKEENLWDIEDKEEDTKF